jgi:hypothetical protein
MGLKRDWMLPQTRQIGSEALELVGEIRQLMAGRLADLQGSILADLLAIWLAGHIVPGDTKATDDLREQLLAWITGLVRELIPPNHAMIHEGKT